MSEVKNQGFCDQKITCFLNFVLNNGLQVYSCFVFKEIVVAYDLDQLPRATHEGVLKLGGIEVRCWVLEDGRRILSERGMLKVIGRSESQTKYNGDTDKGFSDADKLGGFLGANNLKPFISKDLKVPTNYVKFTDRNNNIVSGFICELLNKICDVYLDARDAGVLRKNQEHIAERAYVLMRAFANVGLAALIDEATGFQDARAKDALNRILDLYLSEDKSPWAKTFPNEFYEEIFRLMGWNVEFALTRRPQLVGSITNNLVYSRLAPGVLDELKRLVPRDEKGQLKHRYHQHMTSEHGHPKLIELINFIITSARGFRDKDFKGFVRFLNRIYPLYVDAPLFDGFSEEELFSR